MDINERDAVLDRVVSSIGEMEDFFSKASPSAAILKESKEMAEELLKNFQEELRRREEDSGKIRMEFTTLRKELDEALKAKTTILAMTEQLESLKLDSAKAFEERDKASAEVKRMQDLWQKFTSGE
ncbi:MAG: hypothetical protein HQL10_05545 [Nitrospirae bacterium]|uniref:Magnetosome protein Man4 n=1 Tax=uncultured Nitrospirota bacterium TaxID=170969 RepID=A0A142BTV8_9BACT|nr:magnetosome protein Man4 [uncultured Nitrospirota bacterium]MBF0328600.1 hypothetical protein [Nitrospirota bacterium]